MTHNVQLYTPKRVAPPARPSWIRYIAAIIAIAALLTILGLIAMALLGSLKGLA